MMVLICVNVNGVHQRNTLEGRHQMEMETNWKLTRRGWFFLVILPIAVFIVMFTYATHDVCYVGQPDGNMFGYGSCSTMIDKVLKEGK
jgi:TRAP-type uncharacterized transport system fused permease subunit